ncbi:hypothetical protein AGMMS49949_01480 [Alphaproteobacteria bacterium]|nr:hypothetical protein AGMMS49949_01480 [Alphaproteobacteria bacterium]
MVLIINAMHPGSNFQSFQTYHQDLQKNYGPESTEQSFRAALQNLLKALSSASLSILHEPKRKENLGAPDFRLTSPEGIVGYIETKKPEEPLAKHVHSEQMQRYKQLSPNLLLTNYTDFIWTYHDKTQTASLGQSSKIFTKQSALSEADTADVQRLLSGFLSVPPVGLFKVQELAKALAPRTRLLRDFFRPTLQEQMRQKEGLLYGIYENFKGQVFKELEADEFTNVFAQMIVYGLFLGRLQSMDSVALTPTNADGYVPRNFALIRELIQLLGHLDEDI